MIEAKDLPPQIIKYIDTADIVRDTVMNELVSIQETLEKPLDNHNKSYYNGRLDGLMAVYSLINDIEYEKAKLEKEI
jgi:hypothetical protein